MLPLKQFRCWSHCHWLFLILSRKCIEQFLLSAPVSSRRFDVVMSLAFVPAGSVSAFPQHITYSEMHPVCDGFFASQSSLDSLGDCQGKIFFSWLDDEEVACCRSGCCRRVSVPWGPSEQDCWTDWMMKKLHVAGVVVAGERLYPGGLSGQDCWADWMMKKLRVAGVVIAGECLYPGGPSRQDLLSWLDHEDVACCRSGQHRRALVPWGTGRRRCSSRSSSWCSNSWRSRSWRLLSRSRQLPFQIFTSFCLRDVQCLFEFRFKVSG